MRDQKRIERVVAALRDCWLTVPDMRFGQLVLLFLNAGPNTIAQKLFYTEDDEWEANFRKGIPSIEELQKAEEADAPIFNLAEEK